MLEGKKVDNRRTNLIKSTAGARKRRRRNENDGKKGRVRKIPGGTRIDVKIS